jgi:monoterpene epsilon-lactone hydrolase
MNHLSEEKMPYLVKDVKISRRSRVIVWLLRVFLKPWMAWVMRGSIERIAKAQLLVASQVCKNSSGLPLEYTVVGRVPGHVVGNLAETHKPAILYLHGGAFILPASPDVHVRMLAKMCRELDAIGFMVDYRLAPANQFPAALDDCERGYRALLDLGFAPSRIIIAGESAGGNLTLAVIQRIRKQGWPMPCCAVPISPATEMGRIHGPPSRVIKMKKDPILPMSVMYKIDQYYTQNWDASDPELSPLYADLTGFPPLYLLATDNEVLIDDTLLFAQRARAAGIETKMDIWPALPHAFPLFEQLFPEVREARKDIVAFMRAHLK